MRRRLAVVTFAVTSLVVVAFLVPLGLLVREQARDRALAGAQRQTQAVAAGLTVAAALQPGVGLDEAIAAVVLSASEAEGLTVFLPDGTTVGRPDASPNLAAARSGRSFTAEVPGGSEVLVPVSAGEEVSVVRAFVPTEEQRRGVAAAWAVLGGLGALLVAVSLLIADRLGRSVVVPVRDLAATAHRLGEGRLDARVAPSGPPEVAEVGEAFNSLAERLGELLVAERESVADLSHRLRTPLAALRLQAEAVTDPAVRSALQEDVDRLAQAVDRLIDEARRPSEAVPGRADLAAVVRHRAAFWSVLADEQGRPVTVDVPPGPLPVALAAGDVGAVVDTLLENVFAHTPPGTAYRVRVLGEGPTLVVEDDGPGLGHPGAVHRGASGSGSTGLGLDIARRAAERSGGSLVVGAAEGGGVAVVVRFGAPPAAP